MGGGERDGDRVLNLAVLLAPVGTYGEGVGVWSVIGFYVRQSYCRKPILSPELGPVGCWRREPAPRSVAVVAGGTRPLAR